MPINPHNPFKGRHYPGGPGGWQFGGIVTLQSGSPFRITQSADTQNNDSVGAARPDLVPGQTISLSDRDPSRWFNTAAFTASVFHLEGLEHRVSVVGADDSSDDDSTVETRTVKQRLEHLFND